MGGRAMQIATQESKKLGLTVEAGISMVATPPIPRRATPKSSPGMLHKEDSSGRLAMIHTDEANNGGRILIPVDTYTTEFVGDMPNDLANYSSFDMNGYPLVAVLMDSEPADSGHALSDPSAWAFINGRTATRLASPLAKTLPPKNGPPSSYSNAPWTTASAPRSAAITSSSSAKKAPKPPPPPSTTPSKPSAPSKPTGPPSPASHLNEGDEPA